MKIKSIETVTYALYGQDSSQEYTYDSVEHFLSTNSKFTEVKQLDHQSLILTQEYPASENPDDGMNVRVFNIHAGPRQIKRLLEKCN